MLALVHPGFAIPPFVQGIAFTFPAIIAALIEALHFVKTHNLQANILAAEHLAARFASEAPQAETPTP